MSMNEIKELARASADKHEFNKECTEWHSHYYGFILGMQKALISPVAIVQKEQLKAFAEYIQERMWEDDEKDLSEFVDDFLSI